MLPKYGDWQVVRELGRGSFGQVYEIQKEEFGQTYRGALKIISIPKSPDDVDAVRGAGMTDANITEYYHSIVEDSVKEIALMSELQGNSNIVNYQNHEVRKHLNDPGWDIYLQMELLAPEQVHPAERHHPGGSDPPGHRCVQCVGSVPEHGHHPSGH